VKTANENKAPHILEVATTGLSKRVAQSCEYRNKASESISCITFLDHISSQFRPEHPEHPAHQPEARRPVWEEGGITVRETVSSFSAEVPNDRMMTAAFIGSCGYRKGGGGSGCSLDGSRSVRDPVHGRV
jgi:hypothetical protein